MNKTDKRKEYEKPQLAIIETNPAEEITTEGGDFGDDAGAFHNGSRAATLSWTDYY